MRQMSFYFLLIVGLAQPSTRLEASDAADDRCRTLYAQIGPVFQDISEIPNSPEKARRILQSLPTVVEMRHLEAVSPLVGELIEEIGFKEFLGTTHLPADRVEPFFADWGFAAVPTFVEALRHGHLWDIRNTWASALRFQDPPAGFDVFEFRADGGTVAILRGVPHAAEQIVLFAFRADKSSPEARRNVLLGIAFDEARLGTRIISARTLAGVTQIVTADAVRSEYSRGNTYYAINTMQSIDTTSGSGPELVAAYAAWQETLAKTRAFGIDPAEVAAALREDSGDFSLDPDRNKEIMADLLQRFSTVTMPDVWDFERTTKTLVAQLNDIAGSNYGVMGHEGGPYLHIEVEHRDTGRIFSIPIQGIDLPEFFDDATRQRTFTSSRVGPVFNYRWHGRDKPVLLVMQKMVGAKTDARKAWSGSDPITEYILWDPHEQPRLMHSLSIDYLEFASR